MRIVNLATRMDIFRRKALVADSQGLRGQAYDGEKHSPGLLEIQEKSQGDKPSVWKTGLYSGVGSDLENSRWSGLRGRCWLRCNSSFVLLTQASKRLPFFFCDALDLVRFLARIFLMRRSILCYHPKFRWNRLLANIDCAAGYRRGTAPLVEITRSPSGLKTKSRNFFTAGVGSALVTKTKSRVRK